MQIRQCVCRDDQSQDSECGDASLDLTCIADLDLAKLRLLNSTTATSDRRLSVSAVFSRFEMPRPKPPGHLFDLVWKRGSARCKMQKLTARQVHSGLAPRQAHSEQRTLARLVSRGRKPIRRGRCASSSAFRRQRAAMSPFSQQLMYRGREHEPVPLLLSFSHGDSEVRGERYESRSEPSPRTRGYATLRPTSCLCPARRPANCQ